MAIIKSRMRQRRTAQSNYDPSDNMDGEFVMITSGDPSSRDGRAVHVSFEPGQTKRLATYEDMVDDIANATDEVQEQFAEGMQTAIDNATDVINKGNEAIVNANAAIADTEAATSNANAAAEEAKNYVLGDISSKTVTFSEASSRVNIASDESTATLFGKIKKFFTDLKPHAFTAPVQNLTTNVAGSALDATMGATIQGLINAKINNTMTVLPEGGNPQGAATAVGFYTINNPLNMNISGWFNFVIMKSNNDANSRCIVGLYQDRLYYSWRNSDTGLWSEWFIVENTGKLSDLKTTNKNSVVDAVNEVVDSVNEVYDMVGGNVRYKSATLSYVSSTQLKATIEFDAQVLGATATIRRQPSTPISSTTAIDVDIRLVGTKGYVDIYATGSYVSGHVLAVGVMAIIKV